MTPALYLLWIVLCSRISLDAGMVQILVIGAVVTALVRLFMYSALHLGLREELLFYPRILFLLLYVLLLIYEVLKANFTVMKLLMTRLRKIRPAMVKFSAPINDDLTRALLSCAITLTPGTTTVDVEQNIYTVHCLDLSLAEGIESSSFVKLLMRLDRFTEKYPKKKFGAPPPRKENENDR